jgi:hypothetical protein
MIATIGGIIIGQVVWKYPEVQTLKRAGFKRSSR